MTIGRDVVVLPTVFGHARDDANRRGTTIIIVIIIIISVIILLLLLMVTGKTRVREQIGMV